MQRPVNKQKKVDEVLDPVDDDIEKESNYKEQLKSLKKGLIQVLLTGKLRVAEKVECLGRGPGARWREKGVIS